jgi:SAM-dependent methyltransferase
MKSLGRLSDGIRLGWRRGFDSGATLDHVYRDEAHGVTLLGRLIDRLYLDSPGWKGIRLRRAHLRELLAVAIETARAAGRPVRILDIAAGHGRYVLETGREAGAQDISVHLRDRDETSVEAARRLAAELGVREVFCETGDALDAGALAAIRPRPTIVLVSGLYELLPENAPVRASLKGIASCIEDDGRLIYTNQPWHPQHEFIARVLTNREGKPWVMRCRSQAEMDFLVEEAGFRKLGTLAGDEGIFTVSLASRDRRP